MARASATEWSRRVKRWRMSGLTAKEYAAKAGLKASTLTYWSWRLNAQGREGAKGAVPGKSDGGALVELAVARITTPIEIAFERGTRVQVPVGTDEATLAMVVRVLEAGR